MTTITESPFIPLGAANPSAMKRLAIAVQHHINAGKPVPRSPFARMIAKRITDQDDKQHFLASVSGEIGSGKSYSCLYFLGRIAEEVALIRGGTALDYFNPETNVIALEDAQNIAAILANKNKYQCLLIDDGSVGLSAHDWNSKSSKAFIRIATTMRTRRWCILINSPQQKNLDNSLRDFLQVSLNIVGSYHKGGFNILRATSNQIGINGRVYHHKMRFPPQHKIDLWVSFAPPKEIVETYDRVREESAIRLNQRVADTGSALICKPHKSMAEVNTENAVKQHGDEVRKMLQENPKPSKRSMAARLCMNTQALERVMAVIEKQQTTATTTCGSRSEK